ncbi:MAG TPA: hypothetical protein VFU43_30580 [Streptosporangiaceae bacterium]|nr:hypothetical protein [Streptosporangiaceae bacterium]
MTAAPPGDAIDAHAGGDAALRLRHLTEVSGLLWPAPARAGFDVAGEAISEYLLVLAAKRPRLLVPARHPRAAAAAVRRYAEPGAVTQRLVLRGLSTALRTGLGGVALRPRFRVCVDGPRGETADVETIETYLRGALAETTGAAPGGAAGDVVLSMSIGPARANRKPVLQVLTRRGDTVGFAKVGVNDLTRALAAAEAGSLRTVAAAAPRHLTVPSVLHQGGWNGLEVLVLSPLPIWLPRARHSEARLRSAMLEVAEIGGVTTAPLRDSHYWAGLGVRLGGIDDETARALREAYARIGELAGAVRLRYGSWHGDWTSWNMATLRDTLLVWDWERFSCGVPLGFDAVHYAFQEAVVRGGADPAVAVTRTLDDAARLLAPFGAASPEPAAAAHLTALLYFIDIAVRYLADKQAEAGARLGRPREWLLPVLTAQVERLPVG